MFNLKIHAKKAKIIYQKKHGNKGGVYIYILSVITGIFRFSIFSEIQQPVRGLKVFQRKQLHYERRN